MKKLRTAMDHAEQVDRPLSMKERAKKARHEAYVLAKKRRKNDPRTIELNEKMKVRRREANAQAKERRKTDPKQIAFKEKLKNDRQDANRLAKERRKAGGTAKKKADRAREDAGLKANIRGWGSSSEGSISSESADEREAEEVGGSSRPLKRPGLS